jgi:hypothetical protein
VKHKLHGVIIIFWLVYFSGGVQTLIRPSLPCLRFLIQTQSDIHIVHAHPLYIVCPDVQSLVGELLSSGECGSSNPI